MQQASSAMQSACARCRDRVQLSGGQVRSAAGRLADVTYADADLIVWDCPTCGAANADSLDPADG